MAVGTGITEIADSEEEPLTSSPVVVSDAAADKLSTTPGQDAQAVAWLDQDPARSIANEALSRTDGLDVDQGESPSNVETAPVDHIDLQPALQTATNIAGVCMTENPKQVVISAPQDSVAAFGAVNYTGKVHVVGTDGEDSAAQDTAHSPGTGYSLQHDEHMSLSTDTQGKWKGHQKDNPTLAEHLSDSPINTASESRQESFSPEEEARGNLATILKSRVNDSAHLVSDQQDIGQGDTAMGHVIKAGNDDGETSTAQTQHAMALASPVRLTTPNY
ncbi:hypothetical protein N0V95_002620 [Ascochyta clinopodiicola]|nr:hypothetical protein N0V95_002620 [Ascochyta clinopodiicola]